MLNKEMGRNRNLGLVTNIREGERVSPIISYGLQDLENERNQTRFDDLETSDVSKF